jgi:hypothetical protein
LRALPLSVPHNSPHPHFDIANTFISQNTVPWFIIHRLTKVSGPLLLNFEKGKI